MGYVLQADSSWGERTRRRVVRNRRRRVWRVLRYVLLMVAVQRVVPYVWMMLDYPAPGLGGSVMRARFALVVQWIGCRFPMLVTLVRVQPGVLLTPGGVGDSKKERDSSYVITEPARRLGRDRISARQSEVRITKYDVRSRRAS